MSYVLFIVGSVIEFYATMTLMLVAYRIECRKRRCFDILALSLVMPQVSYFTRLSIGEASSFVQLGLTIIAIWLIFKIPLFYSVVMNVFSLACGFVAQGLIILAISFGMGVPLNTVISEPDYALPTQILTALLFLTVTYVIKTYNFGFDFVPTSYRTYVSLRGLNVIILTAIIVSIVTLSIASFLLSHDFKAYLLVVVGVFAVTIPLFLYYSFRKDNENVEKSIRIPPRSDDGG